LIQRYLRRYVHNIESLFEKDTPFLEKFSLFLRIGDFAQKSAFTAKRKAPLYWGALL